MFHFRYIIISAAALLLLPACTKDPAPADGALPMRLELTLAGDTKGSLTTADLTDFYMQVVSGDPAYNYFEHISKNGSAWTAPSALFWKDETTLETFYAAHFGSYAFEADDFDNGVDLDVPADQSSQERLNAADLLTMHAVTVNYKNTVDGTLSVTLDHGLARLCIVVSLGPDFYNDVLGRETSPFTTFVVKGALVGFHFDPLSGEVSANPGTKRDLVPFLSAYTPGTASAKTATATYEFILPPQEFEAGELEICFSVGSFEYEWFNASKISLTAGKTRELTVSVNLSPQPKINGHSYVEMGDGLKWATCNVGAVSPEGLGDYFAWGEVTPYYQEGYAYETPGDHWKAGKEAGYNWASYRFDNSVSHNGSSFSRYNGGDLINWLLPEDDAAQQNWGGSWRLPTEDDWNALRNSNNFTWTWTTDYNESGVDGMLVTSRVAGFEGNCIFLPAAGSWENTVLGFKTWGLYWSSSVRTGSVNYASELYFASYSPGTRYEYRFTGLSVRPVSE